MHILQRRDLVNGGYTPGGRGFDAILVCYYEGRKLMFVAKVRAGFTLRLGMLYSISFTALRPKLVRSRFTGDAPKSVGRRRQSGRMLKCRWLRSHLSATIESLNGRA
jgi:hypothetical protein